LGATDAMSDRIPVSEEGFQRMQEKLRQLKDEDRPRIEKALGDAREKGDISENAEFETARDELWMIDQKIGELEQKIALAYIVDPRKVPKDQIAFGCRVKVKDHDTGDVEVFELVGEGEAEPARNRISTTSPLAQGMIGGKVGDVLKITTPGGLVVFEVLEIGFA
jgi:transcription elongation factor GreA